MDNNKRKTFNSFYGENKFYYGLEVRPEFADYINANPPSEMFGLDLGCGEGRYALFLAQRGCRVFCIDRSEAGLQKLEKVIRSENLPISTQQEDVAEFTFSENRYDIIVAATILDHLDDDVRSRVVKGIKSSLKPGGILYANVFTIQDPGCQAKHACLQEKGPDGISDTSVFMEHYFGQEELKDMFADFEICFYYEGMEEDLSHGSPHTHGWASLLAKKPGMKRV
jgi:tellurite methyltransferase